MASNIRKPQGKTKKMWVIVRTDGGHYWYTVTSLVYGSRREATNAAGRFVGKCIPVPVAIPSPVRKGRK